MTALPVATDQSAAVSLLELTQGAVVTQSIYAAAKLGIADVLSDGALTAAEIAERVGSHPEATYRLLRTLSGYSVFTEREDGRFELTPVSDALREGAPDSMRGMALVMGHPLLWQEWEHLLTTVRTGEANTPKLRGMSTFDFLMSNPEYASTFFQAMGNLSAIETDPVVAAYDFSRFGTIIDVGGGGGALLAKILQRAPGSRGILFDAPHATGPAAATFEEAGVAARCRVENGSYFEGVPAGGDAYLLKHTLHDFQEPQCLAVLGNIRQAISPDGSLFVVEYVIPGDNARHAGNFIDLWLMLMLDAKERTSAQYADLFARAGFRLTGVIPTSSPASIIEATPC
jgi:hypothetical protein